MMLNILHVLVMFSILIIEIEYKYNVQILIIIPYFNTREMTKNKQKNIKR